MRQLFHLAIETWWLQGALILQAPSCRASSCAVVMPRAISASGSGLAWFWASGRPKRMRDLDSQAPGPDSLGSADDAPGDAVAAWVSGQGAFEADHRGAGFGRDDHVVEEQGGGDRGAQGEFALDLRGGEAGVPVSMRKPRMPSSVMAHTTARSAMAPLVIHIFAPLMTQSVPALFGVGLSCSPGPSRRGLGEAEAADESPRPCAEVLLLLVLEPKA